VIRLAVRCRPELAGVVLAELTTLAPNGVEEERGEDYVEFAIYGAEGELPELGEVRAVAGEGLLAVVSTEIPDDWADRWQDFHKPLLVGGRLWVRPSWERSRDGELDVVIDPGRAFGTGAHPTTRLCLELLIELADEGEAHGGLADLGSGSGVLAIAAAKLGWNPVRAYDHEQAAVDATLENARNNGVDLVAARANLRTELPKLAATVTANLTMPLLLEVAGRLDRESLPRALVCSGLLRAEADAVAEAFATAGLAELDRRSDGDWAALHLIR
jgi:ribosomal protein L11 methyltransferase